MSGFTTALEADSFSESYNFNLYEEIVERTATKVKSSDGNFKEVMNLRIAWWDIGKRCIVTELKSETLKETINCEDADDKILRENDYCTDDDSSFDSDNETDFVCTNDGIFLPNKARDTHHEATPEVMELRL